jgi:hypothetical protein
VRYLYRRINLLLRREGWEVNTKPVCRLYREMGLQLRNKTPKRRVKAKLRSDRTTAGRPARHWPDQSARRVGAPGLPKTVNRGRFISKLDAIWRMSDESAWNESLAPIRTSSTTLELPCCGAFP